MKLKDVILLLVLTVCALTARAQSARISGQITDPQGGVVVDANVSVRNIATGVHRETRSTDAGIYSVAAIEPGRYVVRVDKPGFQTVERRGLELFVDTETRVDIHLKLGSATETITVDGDEPLSQPNNSEAATEVTGKEYLELPLLQQGRTRSPAAFVFLAPGVQGNYTVTGAENTAATNQFVVNGSQMQVTEFFLEGAQAGQMRTVGSFNESAPAVDAIREFKMTTTMLSAEYGHSGPAAGIFSIRSGTNEFHGTAYEYLRNNYFDGKPWGAVIPTFTRLNEFGMTLGGPITIPHVYSGHDRTFFFFSYGGGRKSASDNIQTLRVPSPDQLNGIFDPNKFFKVYDPNTTRKNPSNPNGFIRDQFPNNTIPQSRIDPTAKAIAAFFPKPNLNTTSTKNYQTIIGERYLNPDVFTGKVNHNFNEQHRLSVTYVDSYIPRNKIGTGLPFPLRSDTHQTTHAITGRINYDWLLGTNRVNSLIFGYNRFTNVEIPPNGSYFPVSNLPSDALPRFSFTQSYPDIANNGNFNNVENNYQVRDVFRWTLNAHNLSFGGELRNVQLNDSTPVVASTVMNISDLETQNPANAKNTGDAFGSFLLGQVHSAAVTYPYEIATRYRYAGFFLQDDWRATQLLTLNFGLRWDFQTFPTEKANHNSILDLTSPNPGAIGSAGPLPGALIFAGSGTSASRKSAFGQTSYDAIGPRFGFAFQARPSLLLRGGYGIFYANTGNTLFSAGFQAQGNTQSPDNGLHAAFILGNGFPNVPGVQPTLSPTLLNPTGSGSFQNASYIGPNAGAMPRIQEWTTSVQKTFGKNWLVEAYYIGTHGTRLIAPQAVQINQLDPKYLYLGSLLQVDAKSSSAQAAGVNLPYAGFSGTVFQALRPYPQYNNLTSIAAKSGYNIYHSLQLVLRKRFNYGLTLNANYTFAKNLGISSPGTYGGGVVDNVLQNAYDPRAESSLLPIDVTHAVVIHYTYDLPFGHGQRYLQNGFASAIAGGWKLSGVQRYQSGYPLSILTSNTLGIGNRVMRPNIVPGVDPSTHRSIGGFDPQVDRRINPAAFVQPAAYTFGNAKPTYGSVRNFPVLNEDFAVIKETRFGERLLWNLYLQTFNTFNRHRFTAFDTNAANYDATIDPATGFAKGGTFGQPSTPSQPRYIQIATRLIF